MGVPPGKPAGKPVRVIVPVSSISRLTEHAISEALSLSRDVVAVSVAMEQAGSDHESPDHEGPDHEDPDHEGDSRLEEEWAEWDPGVPLRILPTEYASVVGPILAFIDEARRHDDHQIVVLIPVVVPEHLRYRILHNQIDVVLTAALRSRTDVVVARVGMPLRAEGENPVA